ncbi:MAG: hypothetical protein AB7Q37_03065 [Pyrinomonadaceae bacterium]
MELKTNRREFIRLLAGAAAFASIPSFGFARARAAFDMLVVGDSLIWGQGLHEEQKFYTLTKEWIEKEILAGSVPVELKVLAHSGSRVKLDPRERAALDRANRTGSEALHPEVNVSFPTIERQLAAAVSIYSDPKSVDLIMLSGGIPDVGVAKIIDPFESNKRLRERIDTYCRKHLGDVLADAAERFPNAKFALIGYYPIITRYTPMKRIVNDILELYHWPRWSKPLVNNALNRSIFRLWKRKMIKRSRIWLEDSTAAFRDVARAVNQAAGRERAVFIPSPITERQSFGTPDSRLFTVARRGRPADPKGDTRLRECGPALSQLREETRLEYRTRFCELASVGHPNPAGAAAIAAAIRNSLRPLLTQRVSNR